MIKNIIFDVGEVLFSYGWIDALVLAGESRESAQVVGPQIFDDPLWKELDLGIRPYFEVVDDMCRKYPDSATSIRKFLTNVEVMPKDRPEVWKEVHKLKEKGYHLYLLSNYSEYMFTIHTKDKPFMKDIDGAMVSYMVHINKPDEGIYKALLDKYTLDPSECFFFDDRAENTEGAGRVGIKAVTVLSEEFLLEELRKL